MFNAPRKLGGSALGSSSFLNSSTTFDPLAQSTNQSYGEVDPWSTVPTPVRSGTPRRESEEVVGPVDSAIQPGGGKDGLNAFINDPPPLYLSLLDSLDPSPSGTVPLSSVHRLLASSKLPASTAERIITLTARDSTALSRSELFCAFALVALAQSQPTTDPDVSIERLSAAVPNIPLPSISARPPSPLPAAAPAESPSLSPWDTAPRANGNRPHAETSEYINADSSAFTETADGGQALGIAAEKGYWKKLEKIDVSLMPEKEGWFLQKYTIESDKRGSGPLSRRYSDFVWLLDCLTQRYPFRLLPTLPPKRMRPDTHFLEQRRKGLKRFLNMLVNHPVTRDDGALNVFLTEPTFEAWRKRTKVSTDEESSSKRLTTAEEMGIPADLDEKLGTLRDNLPGLVAGYQKLVLLAERSLARLQAANADASRIALSLGTVGEAMGKCCFHNQVGGMGRGCSLCEGVGRGLGNVSEGWTRVAEEGEKRATTIVLDSIEALKTQRDLYVAFRDLFVRHDKLSKDPVDALRKKVEGRQKKMETLKSAKKPGWEVEVDKLIAVNDQDNSSISSSLARRVFIRACMWHELALVFHSRQAAQATLGWRDFVRAETEATKGVQRIWEDLAGKLEAMPVE